MMFGMRRVRTVGDKMVRIVVVISAAAVAVASAFAGARTYYHLREQALDAVAAQALIVAVNSSAPLAFADNEMARDALSAFRVVEGVRRATLVDREGEVFAEFVPPENPAERTRLYPLGQWREGDDYVLVVPVRDQAGLHGRLQVDFSSERLRGEALSLALQTCLLSLGAIVLAWWLARRLHPLLTSPIVELDGAARRVRDTGDYGVRAVRSSDDELGQLTEAFNEMLGRIEAHQRALVESQRRAEESSRLKDEFVATVSHELRTPLSPILAWIHMLRMPGAPAQLPQALDVMERNTRALVRIIDDLLDMSRIVSGTLRMEAQPVDLATVVRAAVETLAPTAATRGLQVSLQLSEDAPAVRGDPARLQQVVWNLLANAIKFSPQGGTISIGTAVRGSSLELLVADEGIGISPEFLPYVFDRFRQQDGSITRAHGGLGLGLAIVRQVVEQHGGSVRAESAGKGHGARFSVRLPTIDAANDAVGEVHAEPAPVPRLDGANVLLVEDHADMRFALCSALRDAGAAVREAGDAVRAIEAFGEGRIDVLVSDIGLPDMDGYALLRVLRRDFPAARDVPAIAVSAYVRPEERERATAAGYQAHLGKPVDPADLVALVARVLGRREHPGAGAGR